MWIIFGAVPYLDQVFSMDVKNPTKDQQKEMKNMLRFKIPLIITLILDWYFLFWSLNEILKNENGFIYNLGILLSITVFEGVSINASHEMNHKIKYFDCILGTLNLSKSFYMHFFIEHNLGHHRNVATFDDPATSRLNESLYQFLPRTVINTFFSAWKIENEKCKERYNTIYTIKNRMIYFTLGLILMPLFFYYLYGLKGMLLQIIIGVGSLLLLEIVNYIEHYGLQRKKLENGTVENVNKTHSWNAPHRLSNYILLKLQRHSDHHENSLKPYQNLCTHEDSPLLPNGYSLCTLMALNPNLWFEVMNPMVETYRKNEKPKKEFISQVDKKLMEYIYKTNAVLLGLIFIQFSYNSIFLY